MISAFPSHATDWQWYTGGGFNALQVINPNETWLGGELLVKGTRDPISGNWSWEQKAPEVTENRGIKTLSFYDSSHGMAIGSDNTILYTSDGGSQWQVHSIPSNIQILKIQMVGSQEAYGVGEENQHYGQALVVYTRDGGSTWTRVYTTNSYYGGYLLDIKMWPDGHGVAVGTLYDGWGHYGVVLETDDNWRHTATILEKGGSDHELWGLAAPTEKDYYVIGGNIVSNPYLAFLHKGSSLNWGEAILPSDIVRLYGVYFDSANHGWVLGRYDNEEEYESGAVLLETSDGGFNWHRTNFPSNTSVSSSGDPTSLVMLNLMGKAGDDLFIAQSYWEGSYPCFSDGSYGACAGVVLHSSNGGSNWERVKKLSGYTYTDMSAHLDYTGNLVGHAVGHHIYPSISFIQDLEPIQKPLFLSTDCRLSSFSMVDPYRGWAAYCNQQGDPYSHYVLGLEDGGNQRTSYPVENEPVQAYQFKWVKVSASDFYNVWIAFNTDQGGSNFFVTSDHGQSWHWVENAQNASARFQNMDGQFVCYLNGYGGFNCTKDGGANWQNVEINGEYNFIDFYFLNQRVGWAWGTEGTLYKTTDGGSHWSVVAQVPCNNGPYSGLCSLKFSDEYHGWKTDGTTWWKTQDGGLSWEETQDGVCPTAGTIHLALAPNGGGWAYTSSGMILKRDGAQAPSPSMNSNLFHGGMDPETNHLELAFDFPSSDQRVNLYISLSQPAYGGGRVTYYFTSTDHRTTLPNGIYFNKAMPTTEKVPYLTDQFLPSSLRLYGELDENPIFNDGWLVPASFHLADGSPSCQALPDGDYVFQIEAYQTGTTHLVTGGSAVVTLDRGCQ